MQQTPTNVFPQRGDQVSWSQQQAEGFTQSEGKRPAPLSDLFDDLESRSVFWVRLLLVSIFDLFDDLKSR